MGIDARTRVGTHADTPTAERALELLARREISAVELAEQHLAAIGRADPELHCFLHVTADAALERARAVDAGRAGGPLAGVPLAHKDIFCTAGIPTTAGSRILQGFRPLYDATLVRRLDEAGVALLGKCNTDEFAMGSSTENSAYGPSRNPHALDRVPGGSSGGPASAVAAGLTAWATGTDTGGSIRQPAAVCGVVGLKPTYGAVSRYGLIAFASSLDQAGPIARTVRDAALLYAHMAGHDPCDSTSVELPEAVRLPTAERLDGLRLGVPWHLLEQGVEAGVRARFDEALAAAEELGARVVDVELPTAPDGLAAYYLIAPAECSANLSRFDGVRFGARADIGPDEGLLEMYERTRAEGFGDEVKRRIMLGAYALSAGYYDAYYGQAQRARRLIAREHAAAFERCDLIATPTSPTVAFALGARTADPLAMYASDALTVPASLAALPAISLPCGTATDGGSDDELPVGLQLVGPAFSENRILDAAHALEGALA